MADEVRRFPNLMVVKSMSKDFGVAGIRAGYAVMAPERVQALLDNGYLWNSSGLAEYFFDLYARPDFQEHCEHEGIRFIRNSRRFFAALPRVDGSARYPTTPISPWWSSENGLTTKELVWRLLDPARDLHPDLRRQARARPGKFVRIAARNRPENAYVIRSLRRMIG